MREEINDEMLESVAGGILSLDRASDGSGDIVVKKLDGNRNLICEYTISEGMAESVVATMKNDYGRLGGDNGTLEYMLNNNMITLR